MTTVRRKSRRHIRLIHCNTAEAEDRARKLRGAGYDVTYDALEAGFLRELRACLPSAVIVDLSRLPSQGRDVAIAIRHAKALRHVPLVFVGGHPDKLPAIKKHLPDAVYTNWSSIRTALKKAIASPISDPVVPKSGLAGYSGTPLPKKLGFKANSVVVILGAPPNFEKTLGELPSGVTLRKRASSKRDLTIWFVKSGTQLRKRIDRLAGEVRDGGLWIAWPKKASGVSTDLSGNSVRKIGLESGLVDYKICAIDDTWSGLKFARRKADRG